MRLRNSIILFIILIILLLGNIAFVRKLLTKAEQVSHLRTALNVSHKSVLYFKTKSDKQAARIQVISYNQEDLKRGVASEIIAEIKNLGLQPKHITNYSETVVQNEKHIETILHDSIIFDTVKC